MCALIKKIMIFSLVAVLIFSLCVNASEIINYDFDNSGGTLNAIGMQRNAENAVVEMMREDGNTFGHLFVPDAPSGKAPYVVLRQVLADKSFSIESGKCYVFSMDIKTDSISAGNQFYLFNWQYTSSWVTGFIAFSCSEGDDGMMNVNFMDQNSMSTIGTASVERNSFFNVMSVLDGTTKTFDYFCNGIKITEEPIVMTDTTINYIDRFGFRYHCNLNSGDANIYYDNVKVETIDALSVAESSIPETGTLDINAENISITFNEKIDPESAENIKLYDESGNEAELSTGLAENGRTVNITLLQALRGNCVYRLSTSGVKHCIANLKSDEEITFTTGDGINITKPVLCDNAGYIMEQLLMPGEYTAKVYADNDLYKGDITDVTLIMAYYCGKKLLDARAASLSTLTEEPQEISISMNIAEVSPENYVKIFVVNNQDEMQILKYGVKISGVN